MNVKKQQQKILKHQYVFMKMNVKLKNYVKSNNHHLKMYVKIFKLQKKIQNVYITKLVQIVRKNV